MLDEKKIKIIIERDLEKTEFCNCLVNCVNNEIKTSLSMRGCVVFILYTSLYFLKRTMRKYYELQDARFVLFSTRRLLLEDVLSISEFAKGISAWGHINQTIPEIKYMIQHTLQSESVAFFFPEFPSLSNTHKQELQVQNKSVNNYSSLTDREVEVLAMITEGASNKQIAEILYISENTVKTHVRRILEKLQLDSRTKAALYAIDKKLTD